MAIKVVLFDSDGTLQQNADEIGNATRRDHLPRPRTGALRGSQRVYVRRASVALQIRNPPSPLLALQVPGHRPVPDYSLHSGIR